MHFCTDIFFEQLNNVSKCGTIFIFNITLPHINWYMNKSYIKSNDTECIIFFEWIHNIPVKEKIISVNEINQFIKKYEWIIIDIKKMNDNNLISCYDWYILQKK